MSEPARSYDFGPFRLEPAERSLFRDGEPVPLTPKCFDTLLALVQNRGHLLEKNELMEMLWPDAIVEEANLTVTISMLRKALGRSSRRSYIETVPKRGYRFVADVKENVAGDLGQVLDGQGHSQIGIQELAGPESSGKPTHPIWMNRKVRALFLLLLGLMAILFYLWLKDKAAPQVTEAAAKSIAVLPFRPISGAGGDEFLELGMADALITKLSNIRQLVVRPTSAVRKYAETESDPVAAGRELRVESVLEGTVQQADDRLRVTVQLVNVDDGRPIWAGTFDEDQTDIFALQDSISEKVAGALALELTGEEMRRLRKRHTQNTEAYLLYERGRYFWNRRTEEGLLKSIQLFQEAIEKDPNYALAYAGLADSYALLNYYSQVPHSDTYPRARAAAEKALQLDDDLVEAHTTLAYIKYNYEWDWTGAERAFLRAIEENPNYATARQWYAEYLVHMERFDEAGEQIQRAYQLDPLSLIINTQLGSPYVFRRQYNQAIEKYRKALEMEPGFRVALYGLAMCYEQQGQYDQAVELYEKMASDLGSNAGLAGQAYVYAVSGRIEQARRVLDRLLEQSEQHQFSPFLIATVYAGLGENDEAFAWLEKTIQQRDERIVTLRVDPKLDQLRSDPRFAQLLRQVGLATR